MKLYKKYIDNSSKHSINFKMRQARLKLFVKHIQSLERPVSIIDIGGSARYWESFFFSIDGINKEDFHITITNLTRTHLREDYDHEQYYNYDVVNACDMHKFSNNEFDVVHSNSVIEHVGMSNNKEIMAKEIIRVGKKYFVQTPNYWFIIEPHFRFFGFQWLPYSIKHWLVKHRKMGSLPKACNDKEAKEIVGSINLLTYSELKKYFPNSKIWREKFIGLTKSFVSLG